MPAPAPHPHSSSWLTEMGRMYVNVQRSHRCNVCAKGRPLGQTVDPAASQMRDALQFLDTAFEGGVIFCPA